MEKYFSVNDVFQFSDTGDVERIVWIDSKYEYCVTIDVLSSRLKISFRNISELITWLKDESIYIKREDPTFRIVVEEEVKEKNKSIREKAFEIVKFLFRDAGEPEIYYKHHRRKSILKAVNQFNIGEKTVYKYLRKFLQAGKIKNSLLPDYHKCGGKGKPRVSENKLGRPRKGFYVMGQRKGINVDDEIRNIFKMGIDKYYKTPEKRKVTQVFQCILDDFFTETVRKNGKIIKITIPDDKKPTLDQFKYYFYYVRNRNFKSDIIGRDSEKHFMNNCKGLNSSSLIETIGPGFRYQIDATMADVYLVNRFDRISVIGRPIVYIAVDVFSKMITALYIALEGPNWNGVSSLIYNMMEDKVEYCRRFGVEIRPEEWNIKGLPDVILADRGETVGPAGERVIDNIGITLENTPSYIGAAKGLVEQYFHSINLRIKQWDLGFIKKQYRERGGRDYRQDAKLDIQQFTEYMIYAVIAMNKRVMKSYKLSKEMVADGVRPIPIEIWDWGIKNRSGKLMTMSDEMLKLSLMRKGRANVTEEGIKFGKKIYTSEKAQREQWFTKARIQRSWYVDVCYDNRNINHIYIFDRTNNTFEICTLREDYLELYGGLSFEEYEDLCYMQEYRISELRDYSDQINTDLNQKAKALEKNADDNDSKRKNIKNIRENRRKENDEYRKEQALKIGENVTKKNKGSTSEEIDDSLMVQVKKRKEILGEAK